MTRSVTAPTDPEDKAGMSAFGYLVAAGTALLFLPLLPFLAVLWVIDRARSGNRGERAVNDVRPER